MAWKAVLWIVASYLIGSIPFGLLVSKGLYKQDLREMGSGNIGATNVLRNYGVKLFIAVMLLDIAKGFVAVKIGAALGLNPTLALLSGLAAIIGHNWSIYLKLKGGKGIATSGGVIIAAYPWQVTIVVLGTFLVMVLITRIMSVGSITAAVSFPISAAVFMAKDMSDSWYYLSYLIIAILGSLLAIYQHRENIKRLVHREEPRIHLRKKIVPKEVDT
jgi:acyl phosphate:glycerol-3-phosphate acyltransferase